MITGKILTKADIAELEACRDNGAPMRGHDMSEMGRAESFETARTVNWFTTLALYAELRRRAQPVTPEETVAHIARLEADNAALRRLFMETEAAAIARQMDLEAELAAMKAAQRQCPARTAASRPAPVSDCPPAEVAVSGPLMRSTGHAIASALAIPPFASGPARFF